MVSCLTIPRHSHVYCIALSPFDSHHLHCVYLNLRTYIGLSSSKAKAPRTRRAPFIVLLESLYSGQGKNSASATPSAYLTQGCDISNRQVYDCHED